MDKDDLLAGKIKLPEVWPHEYEGKPLTITNETGFSAEVTGFFARGEFTHDMYSSWWTSTGDGDKAWIRHIGFFDNFIGRIPNLKEFAFAVRCIRDQNNNGDSENR